MNHFPRRPVRFVPQNEEMLKSLYTREHDDHPDYRQTEDVPKAHMEPQYRTPPDRVMGNQMFRRYPDGTLDLEDCKHRVVDALRKVKDGLPPTSLEKVALSCIYPTLFAYVDARLLSSVSAVQLRLSPWEITLIHQKVAEHLIQEMNWNAGIGH